MLMGWDCISELWPQMGQLFISQMIYETGKPRCNDIDGKTKDLGGKPVPVLLCPP
jgi:hypothetical protein